MGWCAVVYRGRYETMLMLNGNPLPRAWQLNDANTRMLDLGDRRAGRSQTVKYEDHFFHMVLRLPLACGIENEIFEDHRPPVPCT